MSEVKKIPKFRTAPRLVEWVKKNWHGERLSSDREAVFFKYVDKHPVRAASLVAEYASFVGKLDSALEELLKADLQSLLRYVKICHSREEDVGNLVYSLKTNSNLLYSWAHHCKKRLPKDLEDCLDDGTPSCPRWCYRYAKEVLKGRLPEHLEEVFPKYNDSDHASLYAFDVIRGFAPCRLSDSLHAFMVMKSFQDPDDENIKEYMAACESDPNMAGNS